jgi:hypothetical protein
MVKVAGVARCHVTAGTDVCTQIPYVLYTKNVDAHVLA